MKISNSKRQLAQLLIEAGVTQFPEGANWAAQDKRSMSVYCYKNKPRRPLNWSVWHHDGRVVSGGEIQAATLIPHWHQTVLSREEFDQIVEETAVTSEPDADGWIAWNGGECPVGGDELVVSKLRTGKEWRNGEAIKAEILRWKHTGGICDIIAYRLHKPEQAEAPADGESPEQRAKLASIYAPTLDQLLQDWRNADDHAQRKRTEADEAAAMRDERWQAVQARAGEMGVTIDHATEERSDAVLQVTNRSQLELGDVIWIGKSGVKEDERRLPEGEYQVVKVGTIGVLHNGVTFYPDFSFRSWRFVRRP